MGYLSLLHSPAVHLWVQLAALYVVARLVGLLARRFGQPEVVAALLAGVLLGPSVLGTLWPAAGRFMLPTGEGTGLGAISALCLLMVLIMLGAEMDLPLLRRMGRGVATVSVGSIVVPLLIGSAVAYVSIGQFTTTNRLQSAVLIGGALAVSSLPIIARLVVELGVVRRNFGQLAVAAATINDIYGFLLVVAVGIWANSSELQESALPLVGLLLLAVFVVVGQRPVDYLLRRVRAGGPNPSGSLSVAVGVALVAAAVMEAFGVEAALGAFFAGMLIGRSRFQQSPAMRQLESITTSIFAPLYFAIAGLQVDLRTIDSSVSVSAFVALLVAAIVSKVAGTALGARMVKLHGREIGALSILLNGRGAMQVIIGSAGLSLGLLSETTYTILLAVSVVSSVLISPALKLVVGNWPGNEPEQQRLAEEERLRTNLLVRDHRVLVPSLPGTSPRTVANLLDRAWPEQAELTVLTLPRGGGQDVGPTINRQVRELAAYGDDPLAATFTEANLGYGMIGVGLTGTLGPDDPTRQQIGELLNNAPMPVLLVRAVPSDVGALRRVAIAANGTLTSRAAEELAVSLCLHDGATLHIVHVTPENGSGAVPSDGQMAEPAVTAMLEAAHDRTVAAGLRPQIAHVTDVSRAAGLAAYTRRHGIDLLVLSARLRRVQGTTFLGPTVENALRDTSTSVAVVAFPDEAFVESR